MPNNDDRITFREFAEITEYTDRNVFYLKKNTPELVGYDPITKTFSRAKALEMREIRDKFSVIEAAHKLKQSPTSVQRFARVYNIGIMYQNSRYLSRKDIERIRQFYVNPIKRGPKKKV